MPSSPAVDEEKEDKDDLRNQTISQDAPHSPQFTEIMQMVARGTFSPLSLVPCHSLVGETPPNVRQIDDSPVESPLPPAASDDSPEKVCNYFLILFLCLSHGRVRVGSLPWRCLIDKGVCVCVRNQYMYDSLFAKPQPSTNFFQKE